MTSIILLIHFMRQRTQLLDDVAARRIYTYAKNTFVAGILLFFTHMAFFCWLKFLFYGYDVGKDLLRRRWGPSIHRFFVSANCRFMLPVVCNIVLLFAVVVTIFMLLEAGMCGGMQDEGQPATTTAPWASEQLYSEVGRLQFVRFERPLCSSKLSGRVVFCGHLTIRGITCVQVVMELYDDIDTHDRPEHQWGRGGRVIRRGDTQSDLVRSLAPQFAVSIAMLGVTASLTIRCAPLVACSMFRSCVCGRIQSKASVRELRHGSTLPVCSACGEQTNIVLHPS